MSRTKLLPIRGCQNSQRVGDVVFVHGLNGNPRDYWCYGGKPENYWPAWLGDDLPDVGVWSLGYENAAFKSRRLTFLGGGFRGFAMPLTDRAENVLLQLKQEGMGTRPLMFITHSMGGLLVKQLLRTARDSPDERYRSILERTRGVCFIATPHIGSDLAKWGTYFRTLLGANVSMDELRPHEPLLRNLKQWYSNFASGGSTGIKTLSFYEMKPIPGLGVPVVEAGDADPGVPLTGNYPLDEDHSSICKPETKNSPIYREVLSFVKDACFQIPGDLPVFSGATHVPALPVDQAGDVVPPWPPVEEGEDTPGRPGSAFPLIKTLAILVLVASTALVAIWFLYPREQLSFKTLYDNLCPDTRSGDLTALAKITKHLNRPVHWEGIVTKTVSGGGYIRTFNIKPIGAKDDQRPCKSVVVYPKSALDVTLFGTNPGGVRVTVKGKFATFDSLNGAEITDANVQRIDQ